MQDQVKPSLFSSFFSHIEKNCKFRKFLNTIGYSKTVQPTMLASVIGNFATANTGRFRFLCGMYFDAKIEPVVEFVHFEAD